MQEKFLTYDNFLPHVKDISARINGIDPDERGIMSRQSVKLARQDKERLVEFARRLLKEKRAQGMKQTEMAKESGLSDALIGRLMRGERGEDPKLSTILKLRRGLGVSAIDFFSLFDPPELRSYFAIYPTLQNELEKLAKLPPEELAKIKAILSASLNV